MTDYAFLRSLVPGTEVAVCYYRTAQTNRYEFTRVDRINSKGEVKLTNGLWFNDRGDSIRGDYDRFSRPWLMCPEKARKDIEQRHAQRSLNDSFRALEEAVKGKRNGYGDTYLTQADKDQLLALVQALQPNRE